MNARLRRETSKRNQLPAFQSKWLLQHLRDTDWWLRGHKAIWVLQKLGVWTGRDGWKHDLEFDVAYIRDIFIWLPDERWHDTLPPCPECLSSEDVVRHSWRDNRLARRVQGLDSHYFIMSRRYKCQGCAVKHFKMKESAKAAAEQLGMHCVDSGKSNGDDSGDADEDCADVAEDWAPPKYTFMAWNQQSLAFMDYKRGMEFPAFLTHRGGVDNLLLDKMRPDFNKGVRPATFASTVLECCSKKHVKAAIRYEFEHSARKDLAKRTSCKVAQHRRFSEFGDKGKYAGCVPCGQYMSTVYKNFNASIAKHLDAEVRTNFNRCCDCTNRFDSCYNCINRFGSCCVIA